jgi:tRNA(Ile)-lysidine synthase
MASSRTPARPPDAALDALEAILPAHLVLPNPVLAIAYSGGLDSTVLLHAAKRFCDQHAVRLIAFHINHQLSRHAAGWADFCQYTCQSLDVPLSVRTVDVRAQASLEGAAREARYEALGSLCEEHGVTVLATAHHANDQAETVLFNLLRGTGLVGLRGIATSRSFGLSTLVRPLLEIERQQLKAYALKFDLQWIEDESNQDVRFSRNALRHRALPVLSEINPHALQGMAGTARHAASAAALLEELAEVDVGPCKGKGLPLSRFEPLSRPRRANALRYWLQVNQFGTLSEAATEQWITQLEVGGHGVRLCHAGRPFAIRAGHLERLESTTDHPLPTKAHAITWQGESIIDVPAWRGSLRITSSASWGISAERLARESLQLRSRIGGERLQLRADAPSRSLKNLYQEAGIDPLHRRWLPLVYCGEDLVFAAGLGMNVRLCEPAGDGLVLEWQPLG